MSKAAASKNSASVSLHQWRVVEITTRNCARSRHMWGHDVASNQGRASTAIMTFDPATMTATTRSGRNYVLAGLPGDSPLGKAAWEKWCGDHEVVAESDVTGEYRNTPELQADTTITFTKLSRGVRWSEEQ